jgi:ABC-type nitrate/sulfonate/bicarbonate transport system permease component
LESVQVMKAGPARNWAALKKVIYSLVVVAIFIALWKLFLVTVVTVKYFPSPGGVVQAAIDLFSHGDLEGYSLWEHTWTSLVRVAAGFGAAFVLGVLFGLLMGLFPIIYDVSKVVIEPIRFIPPVGWVPLTIVLFVGFSRYVFVIWLGAFFPVFISVLTSVPRVDALLKDAVKVYGGSWLDVVRKVVIPFVMPEILSGARISLGSAWACIVAAEMIGGETIGLGRLILKYADLMMINEVVVGMLLIGILGLLCNEVVLQIEKRLFRWRAKISI